MRSICEGGVHPVKVLIVCVGQRSSAAALWMGTTHHAFISTVSHWYSNKQATTAPSRNTFNPRPVRFAGRCTTSSAPMSSGSSLFSRASARSDAMLKSSEPQNRMLSGERRGAALGVNRRCSAGGPARMEQSGLCSIVGSRLRVGSRRLRCSGSAI